MSQSVSRNQKQAGLDAGSPLELRRQKREQLLERRVRSLERTLGESQKIIRELLSTQCALVEHLEGAGLAVAADIAAKAKAFIKSQGLDPKRRAGLGVVLGRDVEAPQEAQKVNCAERRAVCQGRCCSLNFAIRSDEVKAGHIQWNPEKPFAIAKDKDGVFCAHWNRENGTCGIYEHRPSICRRYSCQKDRRIWDDFDAVVPGPYLRRHAPPR